jgi:hypothetical protein
MAQMTMEQLANLIRTGTPEQRAAAIAQMRQMTNGGWQDSGSLTAPAGGGGGGQNPYASTSGGSGAMMSALWDMSQSMGQPREETQGMATGGPVSGKGAGMPMPGADAAMRGFQKFNPEGLGALMQARGMPPGMPMPPGRMPMQPGGMPASPYGMPANMGPGSGGAPMAPPSRFQPAPPMAGKPMMPPAGMPVGRSMPANMGPGSGGAPYAGRPGIPAAMPAPARPVRPVGIPNNFGPPIR